MRRSFPAVLFLAFPAAAFAAEPTAAELMKEIQTLYADVEGDFAQGQLLPLIAAAHMALANPDAALETARAIPATQTDARDDAFLSLAQQFAYAGDAKSARALVPSIQDKNKAAQILAAVARFQIKSGDLAGAKKTVEAAPDAAKADVDSAIALFHARKGDLKSADAALESLRTPFSRSRVYAEIALILHKAGRPADFFRYIDLAEKNVGNAATRAGDLSALVCAKAAGSQLDDAIRIAESQGASLRATLYTHIGIGLIDAGKPKEALRLLPKTTDSPSDALALIQALAPAAAKLDPEEPPRLIKAATAIVDAQTSFKAAYMLRLGTIIARTSSLSAAADYARAQTTTSLKLHALLGALRAAPNFRLLPPP